MVTAYPRMLKCQKPSAWNVCAHTSHSRIPPHVHILTHHRNVRIITSTTRKLQYHKYYKYLCCILPTHCTDSIYSSSAYRTTCVLLLLLLVLLRTTIRPLRPNRAYEGRTHAVKSTTTHLRPSLALFVSARLPPPPGSRTAPRPETQARRTQPVPSTAAEKQAYCPCQSLLSRSGHRNQQLDGVTVVSQQYSSSSHDASRRTRPRKESRKGKVRKSGTYVTCIPGFRAKCMPDNMVLL